MSVLPGDFTIYLLDRVTPTVIPQPTGAALGRVARDTFANGTERVALARTLTWTFAPMTEAEYLSLFVAVPASGAVRIRTFWPAEGGTGAYMADCAAILSPLATANVVRGRYEGVALSFTQVIRS